MRNLLTFRRWEWYGGWGNAATDGSRGGSASAHLWKVSRKCEELAHLPKVGERESRAVICGRGAMEKTAGPGKQQGTETATQIQQYRNGGTDTATQIRQLRNGDEETATLKRQLRNGNSETAAQKRQLRNGSSETAAQKKTSQPNRMSGGLRCTV